MREFVILGHSAAVAPDFTLKDLPGDAGRLDVLCRCINSAFFLSHGMRRDVRVYLVLQDQYTIRIEGSEVQYLNPDEWSTGSLLQKALQKKEVTDASDWQRSTPGIYIREVGFEDTLAALDNTSTVIQLHEDGDPLNQVTPPDHPVFVLSDHNDFTAEEQDILAASVDQQVRVGPEILHADHVMTVAHHFLDTSGYTQF